MSLSDHPKAYGSAAVVTAFIAGALVTLGFKDFYPDLERRYQQDLRSQEARLAAASSSSKDVRRRSSFFWGKEFVALEDHESSSGAPPEKGAAGVRGEGIVDGIAGCIGNTPLLRIASLSEATGRTILAKAEFLNGAGNSPKDRVALHMIEAAEARGLLAPHRGDTIYEGTVGSTGISLAALARARGYRCHICMPDDQAREKSDLLRHLGAVVERVPVAPITSPGHFVNLARRRAEEHTASSADGSRGFFADQFESPFNHEAHYLTTGPEIWAQTGGRIDAFVAGAGTGGTISGVARYLKEQEQKEQQNNAKAAGGSKKSKKQQQQASLPKQQQQPLKIILADPQGSGLYNKVKHGVMYSPTEREGTRRRAQVDSVVEGVGINRTTANFEAGRDLVDDAVRVTDAQARAVARWLVERDGLFAGSSTAVNCAAAALAALTLPEGSVVVTVVCDPGARHLSKFWRQIAESGLEDSNDDNNDSNKKESSSGGRATLEELLEVLGLETPPLVR
ncbi:Cysteine synthase 2 [Diatrype stigma]|uniref:Cysteine synthase 2 n=1 Tax=Diatrype stigma TaxID=117547 RepID=A0AAN9URV5_9PEZI